MILVLDSDDLYYKLSCDIPIASDIHPVTSTIPFRKQDSYPVFPRVTIDVLVYIALYNGGCLDERI